MAISSTSLELQTASIEACSKRLAIDELGGDEVNVADLPDVVNRENVRMIQGRGRSRFLREPPYAVLIGDELRRQHLHRDLPAEPHILRQIHLAHAARAELFDDPIVGNVPANHE